jgi:hypothetical protein
MPRIEDIEFARLVSDGKVYRAPCLVYRNSVDGRWWRKDGGRFLPEDFTAVIDAKPECIVLGTGIMNKVEVTDETIAHLQSCGASVEVLDSKEAAARYNQLFAAGKDVVGAFHLM